MPGPLITVGTWSQPACRTAHHGVDERAVFEDGRAGFLGGIQVLENFVAHIEIELAEVHAAEQAAHHRHDDVFDQGFDDLLERTADDHTNGEIDNIPLDGKFLELGDEAHKLLPL